MTNPLRPKITATRTQCKVTVSEDTHSYILGLLKTAACFEMVVTPRGKTMVVSDHELLVISQDPGCNIIYQWFAANDGVIAAAKQVALNDPTSSDVLWCVSPLHALVLLSKTPRTLLRSTFACHDWTGWLTHWALAKTQPLRKG